MKYAIAKIGQKIIFDRDSKDCDRSNTNGNVGTYMLFTLLAENNPEDSFYVISNNDNCFKMENMFDASMMSDDDLSEIGIDAMFVLTGLTEFEHDDRLFNIINNLNAKFILMSDDPRCLDSVESDKRLRRIPDKIVSQFEGTYNFKGMKVEVDYVPLETASCYKWKYKDGIYEKKSDNIIVIANTSGKEYDRVKILSNLIANVKKIPVYGRLTDEEKKMLGEEKCKGEIKFNDMQEKLASSYSTLLIPIKKGWVTSKYVEALMNMVVPIFYEDYNTKLIECNNLIVIKNHDDFKFVLNKISSYKERFKPYVESLIKVLVLPYVDGKILSKKLIECVGGK